MWEELSNFRLLMARDLDLDLGSGHTAYHHTSDVDLYLHTKFHWNRRNFFVDRRTYGRAGGHLRPALLSRLGRVDLKSKIIQSLWVPPTKSTSGASSANPHAIIQSYSPGGSNRTRTGDITSRCVPTSLFPLSSRLCISPSEDFFRVEVRNA